MTGAKPPEPAGPAEPAEPVGPAGPVDPEGVTTLYVWRVPGRAVPRALARLATDRLRLRAAPGVRFAKLLGTGRGTTFGPGDVDPTRYAALVVWRDPAAARGFAAGPVGRGWARLATAAVGLELRPLSSRGRWSGHRPFRPAARAADGPVLALTRARLRPTRAVRFWRAVPPVAAELHAAPGLLAAFGVGEAPLGWQGTVSLWRTAADLTGFAYRQPGHRAAITRTPAEDWYAEELFARFAVLRVDGDRTVLGPLPEQERRDPGT